MERLIAPHIRSFKPLKKASDEIDGILSKKWQVAQGEKGNASRPRPEMREVCLTLK